MKLIAKDQLHLGDEYASRLGKRYRVIGKGEEFDVADKDGKRLVERGLAVKPEGAAEEKAAKDEEIKNEAGSKATEETVAKDVKSDAAKKASESKDEESKDEKK